MKKRLVLLMAALMLMVTFADAEGASGDLFAQIDGRVFEFCSGAGAWSTELTVGENGAFTGNFHDSEMGETGENYPDGTLYGCSFHGRLSDPEPVDEYAWTVKLSVEQDEGQVPEAVEDGIRYVTAAPYGLEKAQTVTVFLPGTPVDRLPEDFMIWSHLQEIAPDAKAIPYYAIWNEADEAGFIAVDAYESQDEDFCFSGEWLEKDTQFTALNVTKKTGEGWDVELLSPVSHGAWVIRATAYYDSDSDAFVYSDGVKYNLIPGEADTEEEAAAGLWGTLQFAGTAGHPQLVWHDMMNTGGETVVFERAPGLPAYVYTGDDPMEGAIADFLACGERAESYLTEPGYVTIPCPIIHRTKTIDDAHAKVYGSFWILNYVRRGETLLNISGGEYPAILMLEQADGRWRVTAMEEAGDGEDYTEDIERFADGDQELADQYYAGADLDAEANQAVRTRFIKAYVEANGLNITAYQDYGWEPVKLN